MMKEKAMLDLTEVRTLSDEAEYEAALKAVRPYFENEPAEDSPTLRTSTPWCC